MNFTLPPGFIRARWTGFSLLAAGFVLGFFHRIAPAVVAPDLVRDFAIPAAALGSLSAMYYYVYTAMQIPSGIVSDTLGPRYTVSAAGLIAALGTLVFATATSFEAAAWGRLLVGLGASFTFIGLMKYNTLWFEPQRYGAISGLTLMIGNLGAILAAAPLALLLEFTGWRQIFLVIGGLSLGLSLWILLALRNRPEDAGFPSLAELAGGAPPRPPAHHWSREIFGALSNRDVWPGFVVMFGLTGTGLAFVGLWSVPLLTDVHGMSRSAAATATTVMLVGSALGSFFAGSLSDALGRRRPIAIVSGVVAVLCWLALGGLPELSAQGVWFLFALLGLCAGGGTVSYAVAKEVSPPLFAGMAMAIVNTGLFLGAAVVQAVFGAVMDWGWQGELINGLRGYGPADYQRGLLLCTGCAALGLVASLRLRETYCRHLTVE